MSDEKKLREELETERKAVASMKEELAQANARARAAEHAGVIAQPSTNKAGNRKPKTDPVVAEDIADTKVRNLLKKAKDGAARFVDSPDGRSKLALAAQDRLIALRDIDSPYFGHGVALHAGGDLYIHGAGAHPREAAEHLVVRNTVGDLTELVDQLDTQLEYEAA